MTDKTAIEKISALRRNAENDMPDYDFGWDAAIDKVLEALAAISNDAERLSIAVEALNKIAGRGMTGGGIARKALKEIQG